MCCKDIITQLGQIEQTLLVRHLITTLDETCGLDPQNYGHGSSVLAILDESRETRKRKQQRFNSLQVARTYLDYKK